MGTGRFRFGLFAFDAARLELRREGVLVRLQAQPAQVLGCLLERAGEVVSREELRRAVWGETTFVDFEGGLNFCISQLRAALQDDSGQPVYVRTVPKSGYQFIAPVGRVGEETADSLQLGDEREEQEGVAQSVRSGALTTERLSTEGKNRSKDRPLQWRVGWAAGLLILVLAGFLAYRSRGALGQGRAPILAVVRFDNETGDAGMTEFSDGLTDTVVEELTARGGEKYRVIGNAQILRVPREQRDLKAVAASLRAAYVVLGQVQTNGAQVRILAHLIRLSDQTHIWVVRLDRPLADPLKLEAEAAEQIAAEFSAKMAADPSHAASFPAASH